MRRVLVALLACGVLSGAAWAEDPLISKLTLAGFERVQVSAVSRDLPLQKGQPASAEAIEAGRSWLESLGLFISVKSAQVKRGNNIEVVYTVVENPAVGAVLIEAAPGVSAPALRAELETRPKDVLSRVRIASDSLKIAALYRKVGNVVEVQVDFEPAANQNARPVDVTFRVSQLQVGRVVCEPLNYLKPDSMPPFVTMAEGEPLRFEALAQQQRKLADHPLLSGVGEPSFRRAKDLPGSRVEVIYPVQEAEQPLLVEPTVQMVDLDKLRRWVRFSAVDVNVAVNDMRFRRTDQEARELYQRAADDARRQLDDGEAAYQAALWARQAGVGAEGQATALDEAGRRLEALCKTGSSARNHLRLGQVYMQIGRVVDAADQFVTALKGAEGDLLAEVYAELAGALAAVLSTNGEGKTVTDLVVGHLKTGAEKLSKLPEGGSLDSFTHVAQFYFIGLSLARLSLDLRTALRLDGPVASWLFRSAHVFGEQQPETNAPNTAEVREKRRVGHHIGKCLTAVAFLAKTVGSEVIGMDGLRQLPGILDAARDGFLSPGRSQSTDPALPFFLCLNNVLAGNLVVARDEALQGLAVDRQPADERLVDGYVLCCMPTLYSGLTEEQSLKALSNALETLEPDIDQDRLKGPGHALLLAKLEMAMYQSLPASDQPGRAAALAKSARYAELTTQRMPEWASGYWFAGMAALKGANPAAAIAAYERVVKLRPRSVEARYALALAQLVGGQREAGLKGMAELLPKPGPTPGAAAPTPGAAAPTPGAAAPTSGAQPPAPPR